MQKFCLKIPYRYREIIKKLKKIDNSMTSETMFAQSPSIGFKWEIGCTVPRNRNKSDVRS